MYTLMQRIFRNVIIMSQYWDLNYTYCQGLTTQLLCVSMEHEPQYFHTQKLRLFPLLTARPAARTFLCLWEESVLALRGCSTVCTLRAEWPTYSPQTSLLLIFLSIAMYQWLLSVLALTRQTRNGLEFAMMLLFLPPKWWDCRCVPPCLAQLQPQCKPSQPLWNP